MYVATAYVPYHMRPAGFSATSSFSGTLPQVVEWIDAFILDAHKYGTVYNSLVRFGTYSRSCAGRDGLKYVLVIVPKLP